MYAGDRLLAHVALTPKVRGGGKDKAELSPGDTVTCQVTDVAPLYLDVKLATGERLLATSHRQPQLTCHSTFERCCAALSPGTGCLTHCA